MTLRDAIEEAVVSLIAHRLRSVLSMIGIVFGVATVLATFAVSAGARRQALDDVGRLGIDNILIRALRPARPSAPREQTPATALSLDDAEILEANVPGILAITGVRSGEVELTQRGRRVSVQLAGVTADWIDVAGAWQPPAGRWFTRQDGLLPNRASVLGPDRAV